jgi:hypothetical protein
MGRGYYGIAWKAWVIVERVSAFVPGGFPTVFFLFSSRRRLVLLSFY